jgi:hypothetical protein
MYQPHSNRDTLFAGKPSNLVAATQNIQTIHFDDLEEMHKLVWDLAEYVADWKPDLIPFFATGGIPYLIPVMHVLEKKGQRAYLDGQHFHLFPGLTWSGTIEGKGPETFFASSFGEVIRKSLESGPLKVLVIDTTNSGNAVNKAAAACQKAFEASGASASTISLKIIGIVNTSHAEAKRSSPEKRIVTGANRTSYVLTPSSFFPSSALLDRQFRLFSPLVPGAGFSFEVAYWLAGNVPTEDRAELIGVEAVHELLSTTSKPRAGRLKIVYGNGEDQQGTGLGNLFGRLISFLSMSLDAWQWEKMREINSLPPQTPEDRKGVAGVKELSEGGLRLFELKAMNADDAIDELLKLPRLLLDVEVYWLGTIDPPPNRLASKVCASLEKGTCSAAEAVKFFR